MCSLPPEKPSAFSNSGPRLMRGLFALVTRRRGVVIVLALALLVGGLFNLRGLAIDAVPDISPKQVMILTEAQGLGAEEVERLVTYPIETQMAGLPLLRDIRSKSRFGLSAVYVTFDDAADVETARAQVSERLLMAQEMMPPGVGTPHEGPFATGLGEILEFRLRGPGYTPMQLYQMLQWRIVPQLRLVRGVVDVNIYGGDLQTYEVEVSPERLRDHGVTMSQLFHAIESNNAARGGAFLERGDEQEIVRGIALAQGRGDIAAIALGADPSRGIPLTVGDVATVRMAPKFRLGAVTHDGAGETIVGVVDMQYGLNASEVLPEVKARIASLGKLLPQGVAIDIFYDRSQLIQRAIHTVAHNLVEGALLVIGVLLLMLGSLRAGLIVACVIPLSMMIAFAGMRALGISGNLMSLGAIDFGLIVDGAVVLVENILAHRARPDADEASREETVADAATAVARPVIFSVIIIGLVYLPVLSLQDVEGKTFRPMALTVILALAGALFVTMTVVPALAASLLAGKGEARESFVVRGARRLYTPVIKRTIDRPYLVLGAAALGFLGALFLASTLGGEFIPDLAEGAIVVTSNKLPSINLDASLRMVSIIEHIVKQFPDVDTVVSQTGSAAVPTDPMGVQSTDSYVILKPPAQWKTASTQQGIRDAMEKKLQDALPGVDFEFSQPIRMRMDDLLEGVRTPVALSIVGPDEKTLRQLTVDAVRELKAVKGAGDVHAEEIGDQPQVTISIDRQKLARFGLSADDALAVVQAVGGKTTGTVYGEESSETPIMVRLAPDLRSSADQLRFLPVSATGGNSVVLGDIATIGADEGPAEITHDGLRRVSNIDIETEGRDTQGFVTDAQRTLHDKLHLPPGATLQWSGQFQNLQSAKARLELVVPAALAVIFLLLYLVFDGIRPAALIFLNIPLAATGGIVALILRGMPFSVTAGIGFIAVFGVAILDGVVLVSYIEEERARGCEPRQAAMDAAEKRLRPVLTTALVATTGFLPMAVSTSVGAEVQRPLATVVIGGLLTATVLTLVVIPSLYPVAARLRWPKTWPGRAKTRR
jgi:cobalt-zinc-cadmium resistance protein CzcA